MSKQSAAPSTADPGPPVHRPHVRHREHISRRPRIVRNRRRSVPYTPTLFANQGFRTYWTARLLSQTAQGALLYGLLIILVDITNSSFYNSLFVLCAIIPALLFGLPAGIVVDAVPRRPLLVVMNLARFAFAISLLSRETPTLTAIFAATLGIWVIQQFYAPADSATLASLVAPQMLLTAQALANLALSLSQLLGFVIFAPLMLKAFGPHALFALCALLFVAGAVSTAMLPASIDSRLNRARSSRRVPIRQSLFTGWRVVRSDEVIYEVMVVDILIGIGASALVVITPLYLEGVLNTTADNTVFVFAPAAIGLLVGLRMAPILSPKLGTQRVAVAGLMLFAFCIAVLGVLPTLHDVLVDQLGLPIDSLASTMRLDSAVLLVMLISIPAGFASAIVSVATRSLMISRTPVHLRGQVIATQSLLQNVGALVPTLLAGVGADLIGVEWVALAIAIAITGSAIAALTVYRPAPASTPLAS